MGKSNLCSQNIGAFFYRLRQTRCSRESMRINTMSSAISFLEQKLN
jgi:hypothetical protein